MRNVAKKTVETQAPMQIVYMEIFCGYIVMFAVYLMSAVDRAIHSSAMIA